MGDARQREDWAAYLRRITKRPGWSVARLARESGIHRATIFAWIAGEQGVTVSSVRAIATAAGDDPIAVLRAAADITSDEYDEELELILSAPVDDEMKRDMVVRLAELREQDKRRRMQEIEFHIRRGRR
jgi:transcriptional regulator with XRE-family HTH domain